MSPTAQPATRAADNGRVRLTIPAKPEYVALVRLALSGLTRLRSLSEEELGDLKLAVTEACSNSVRHGYDPDRIGVVEVSYELQPDRLVVEVADEGAGFGGDPRTPGANPNEGGLGMAIMRAVTDEFEAGERDDKQGSLLRFVKFLGR